VWPGAAIRVVAAPQVVYLSARLGFTLRDDTIVQDQGGSGGSPPDLRMFCLLLHFGSHRKLDPGRRCPRQPHIEFKEGRSYAVTNP
jgi:hypothetical protein